MLTDSGLISPELSLRETSRSAASTASPPSTAEGGGAGGNKTQTERAEKIDATQARKS